ncbi:NADH-ubiquinone oxidoreductase [Fusarium oxysporum]|nr:NADH-ubiquinone oxidoreductase [Fusarium oxysporum]
MSTISRTLSNLRKVGIKDYFVQMLYIGDTKAGRLIGTDRAGNKFFENNEELPPPNTLGRPGWHAWISYSVDKPPTEDPLLQAGVRAFEPSRAIPNFTQTRGAFKTYNTSKSKISAWEPVAAPRA